VIFGASSDELHTPQKSMSYYDGAAIAGSLSLREAREANAHDYLLKTGMPNCGRMQMWPAVGLSRQTQHADSSYGIQRYGIVE
jgi:hypothetical protein